MPSLDLAVDRVSEVPLGTQLIWKLRTLIATGQLAPGDRVPGLREVAEAAGVNINTVRSVFARLEEQGLLRTEHGRGTFVAPGVQVGTILAEMASAALAQAEEAGIDPRELAAALYVAPRLGHAGASGQSPTQPEERTERRTLRAQIAALEREVARLDPLGSVESPGNVGPLQALAADAGTNEPRVLSAAELREARDSLAARLDQLRRERDDWRVEAEQLELAEREAEEARSRRAASWREAGVWTGAPRTRVSWRSA